MKGLTPANEFGGGGTHLNKPRDELVQQLRVEHGPPRQLSDGQTGPVPRALLDGADVGPRRPRPTSKTAVGLAVVLVGLWRAGQDVACKEVDDGTRELAGVRPGEEGAESGDVLGRRPADDRVLPEEGGERGVVRTLGEDGLPKRGTKRPARG